MNLVSCVIHQCKCVFFIILLKNKNISFEKFYKKSVLFRKNQENYSHFHVQKLKKF